MADVGNLTVSSSSMLTLNKSRKRKINQLDWKNSVRKRLKNIGKSYTSTSGHVVKEKQHSTQGRVCISKGCFKKACANITVEEKVVMFDEFYSRDYNGQSSLITVTPRRLQMVQNKIKCGVNIPTHMRGKHANRPNAISPDVKVKIREHINSFPKQPSHYYRQKTENEF
ncbi:hypothetical protein ANN_28105 [Periplaneta americana]|uniref:Uncharacterized protein n=1 Tax=Periplaneta americana TaxID=6978 RepID=A0ABQ8RUV4_PERAM|nr:hypothetical protein ANN_28105 [Periplaneta americana]